jgi:peptidoglycan/LPS O-acetylase OafA/YrhL
MDINEFGGGDSDNVKFVKDKTLRVLVPYAIVGLFLCLLQDRDISQMLNGISHLWFLMTIFECYVLGMLVDTILKMQERKVQIVMGGLVLFIVLIPYRISVMQFLCLSYIIQYFPFYMLGMLASKMNFGKYTKCKAKTRVLTIILLLFFALQQVYIKKTPITMLLGVSTVSFIFIYARCLNISKLPSWVTSLDKCSMGIYIVHHIVIQEMNPCFPFHEWAVNHYYAYPILQFFIVTGISWPFVAVCQNFKYSKYILG